MKWAMGLSLLVSLSAAVADPIYVFVDELGQKSYQDNPCGTPAPAAIVTTIKGTPKPSLLTEEGAAEINRQSQCRTNKAVADIYAKAANDGYKPKHQAAAHDQMVKRFLAISIFDWVNLRPWGS